MRSFEMLTTANKLVKELNTIFANIVDDLETKNVDRSKSVVNPCLGNIQFRMFDEDYKMVFSIDIPATMIDDLIASNYNPMALMEWYFKCVEEQERKNHAQSLATAVSTIKAFGLTVDEVTTLMSCKNGAQMDRASLNILNKIKETRGR